MEISILTALEDLHYPPSLATTKKGDPCQNGDSDEGNLVTELTGDLVKFSHLVSWLGKELHSTCPDVDEAVNLVKSEEDVSGFKMELSSLLKELSCPHGSLLETPLSDRFETVESRLLALSFLVGEVQAGRMLFVHEGRREKKKMKVELNESPTAKTLREVCQELELGKPPTSITVGQVWAGILPKVKVRTGDAGAMDPLFVGVLSPGQWESLGQYYKELKDDYTMRREMLLKRLDVTVQSFHWSDRLKGDRDKIQKEFKILRDAMKEEPRVRLTDVLAARVDLPIIDKTSSVKVRKHTRSAVNKVVIGKVPDRGGRPDEVEPPPPEMPSWQQRQGAPSGSSGWIQNPNQQQGRGGGRGGRGGGGGGDRGGRGGGGGDFGGRGGRGGGRVQGGWSQGGGGGGGQYHQQQQQRDGYNDNYQGGGGYGGGGGGGHYDQRQNQGGYDAQQQQQQNYYQHDRRDNDGGGGYGGGGGGRGGGRGYRGGGGGYRDNQY